MKEAINERKPKWSRKLIHSEWKNMIGQSFKSKKRVVET